MSYLHCPTCHRAYNLATQPSCPSCGVRPGTPADPSADIVAAAEQLARAIGRATPAQLAAAQAVLDAQPRMFALGAPGTAISPPTLLRPVSAPPEPEPEPERQALLATVLLALLGRLVPAPRAASLRRAAVVGALALAARGSAILGRARARFAR
ncbi:MAG TPA: hypothetical protein VFQ53_38910 [Kofleriaceae bacterium]|nr:hypothetical protein [Kofleriaceae bacterium]